MADATRLVDEIAQVPWFHSIDLGQGVTTPGLKSLRDHEFAAKRFFGPIELAGKSVLDIGAWNGAYSFEAKRRGAARVLATDSYVWSHPHFRGRVGFDLARSALELDIEAREIDIMDFDANNPGTFDVVLFLGVFYRLLDPILGLQNAARCARELLVVESHIDTQQTERPTMVFYPGAELNNDPTNWWSPNIPCMVGLLKTLGFTKIDVFEHNSRGIFHAWR